MVLNDIELDTPFNPYGTVEILPPGATAEAVPGCFKGRALERDVVSNFRVIFAKLIGTSLLPMCESKLARGPVLVRHVLGLTICCILTIPGLNLSRLISFIPSGFHPTYPRLKCMSSHCFRNHSHPRLDGSFL